MREEGMGRSMSGGPERGSRDAMAGAANTPPFEGNDDPQRGGGRPPSHREFDRESEPDRERDRMEGIAPASGPAGGPTAERVSDAARAAEEHAGDLLDRAGRRMDEASDSAADRLEGAANRIRDRAREMEGEPGWRGTAGRYAERAAERGEDAAEYLREAGLDDMRAVVERQVRQRPLQTLLLAAAAGWLVGKILR
jgi:ElaB/YqjD/DUF883 family membrane-anchored ribosome-binding protein